MLSPFWQGKLNQSEPDYIVILYIADASDRIADITTPTMIILPNLTSPYATDVSQRKNPTIPEQINETHPDWNDDCNTTQTQMDVGIEIAMKSLRICLMGDATAMA